MSNYHDLILSGCQRKKKMSNMYLLYFIRDEKIKSVFYILKSNGIIRNGINYDEIIGSDSFFKLL